MRHNRFVAPNRANSRLMSHPTVNPFRLTSGEGGPAIVTPPVIDGIVDAGEVLTLIQQPVWDGTQVSSGWVWTADGSEVPGSADQVTITLSTDTSLIASRYQVVASATNAAGGTSYSRSNTLDKVLPTAPDAPVSGMWTLELAQTGIPIVTGIYSLTVGQQGQRVGLTSNTGSVAPPSVAGFTVSRLQARLNNGRVRFRLNNYNLAFTGQIRISWGPVFENVVVLDFDGDAEWQATSLEFAQYLAAHVGGTVFLQLGS